MNVSIRLKNKVYRPVLPPVGYTITQIRMCYVDVVTRGKPPGGSYEYFETGSEGRQGAERRQLGRALVSLLFMGVLLRLVVSILLVVIVTVLYLPLPAHLVPADVLRRNLDADHDALLQRDGDLLLEILVGAERHGYGLPEVPLGLQLGDLLTRQVPVSVLADALALGRQAVGLAHAGLVLGLEELASLRARALRDVMKHAPRHLILHSGRRGHVRVREGAVEDGRAGLDEMVGDLREIAMFNEDGERHVSMLSVSGKRGRGRGGRGFGAVQRHRRTEAGLARLLARTG